MTEENGAVASTADQNERPPTVSLRMNRVLVELERLRTAPDDESVHALRVAIRRCRSIAAIMTDLDPHPAWRRVRRQIRRLFRALGALRDVQILQQSLEGLAAADDPLRVRLLATLQPRGQAARAGVDRAAEKFDRDAWKELAGTLRRRIRLVPPDGVVAQCLALERHVALRRLHSLAMRAPTPAHWHQLRIGLKHFRYVVEAFLPGRAAAWHADLQQLQDLLGRLHDLNVLDTFVADESAGAPLEEAERLRHAIDAERLTCIAGYRQRARGRTGLLRQWRDGLPRGLRMDAATDARFRATAAAVDPHFRRSARVSRLARELFDALADAGLPSGGADLRERAILRGAARLHGIRVARNGGSRQKAAAAALRAMPVPMGWTADEWNVLAWTVRYHRGDEPKAKHVAFARLPAERQAQIRVLAGVLRLARALARSGAARVSGRPDAAAGTLRLRADGLADHRKSAARLADAKHLLEVCFDRHVIIDRG